MRVASAHGHRRGGRAASAPSGPFRSSGAVRLRGGEMAADVVELAAQRLVLRLEELVRHPWRLEHREGVRALVLAERDHPGGEQGELVLGRPGVHVDDAAGGVGVDREAELAEAVDDLRLAVLVLEFLGELGGPVREVLDLREVAEHDVLRRVEDGGDGAVDHACPLVWYRTNRYDIRLTAPGRAVRRMPPILLLPAAATVAAAGIPLG